MSLDKQRQKSLFKWLKQQAHWHKMGLRLSVLAGFLFALLIIAQAGLLATILHTLIIEQRGFAAIVPHFIALFVVALLRAVLLYWREQLNFSLGQQIRQRIRRQLFDQFERLGPAYIQQQTTGSWSTLLIEQVEDLQDFYARYLPQMRLATLVPVVIFLVILPVNWAAALILFCTAPLIPIFMILVGMGAADVNRRNFKALAYLGGHFLDRLKGLETIRLFNQGEVQTQEIANAAEDFRQRTMQVLKMAFLSSGVLEFFASISIAIVAVYFGFSYLGQFSFGSYGLPVSLLAGFFALILAPEFFQPLRDLGTYYHAKAQAIAAADNIESFLQLTPRPATQSPQSPLHAWQGELRQIRADQLVILSPEGKPLVGPLTFTFNFPAQLSLMGSSGAGKSSLFNLLLGFLPYQGSLKINGIEFSHLDQAAWRAQLSWLGQNPILPASTIRANLLLAKADASEAELTQVITQANLAQMIAALPNGLDTLIGEDAVRLSIGQAQRIALARALLKPSQLLLLDEPTASLDKHTAQEIELTLQAALTNRSCISITHRLTEAQRTQYQQWQLLDGQLQRCRQESV